MERRQSQRSSGEGGLAELPVEDLVWQIKRMAPSDNLADAIADNLAHVDSRGTAALLKVGPALVTTSCNDAERMARCAVASRVFGLYAMHKHAKMTTTGTCDKLPRVASGAGQGGPSKAVGGAV